MTSLHDLTILIKLLKAEGVRKYSDNGLVLEFSGESVAGGEGSNRRSEAAPPQAEAEEAADPEAGQVALPPALRKLNPNYLKLTGVVRR